MPDNKDFDAARNASPQAENDEDFAQDYAAEAGEDNEPAEQRDRDHEVLRKLKEENDSLKDHLQRALADMENLRRRTAREITDAKAYAAAGFARDMLSVADNLSRALSAISPEERAADPKLKNLAEGVEMTERTMMAALQNHGVRKIEAVGQKFDPHLHEAIFEAQDASVPHNTVKQEVQTGYMIGDRVLRAAQVGVAKGGEKQPAETKAPAEAEEGE